MGSGLRAEGAARRYRDALEQGDRSHPAAIRRERAHGRQWHGACRRLAGAVPRSAPTRCRQVAEGRSDREHQAGKLIVRSVGGTKKNLRSIVAWIPAWRGDDVPTYSGLIPAALTTLAHFCVSPAMNFAS